VSVTSSEGLHYKFKVVLESSFNVVWLASFMNCFLQFITISFFGATSQSKLSKGGVFFFFRLCCKIFPTYKANVEEGQLCLILGNAFGFAQYSKTFPPFARYKQFVAFCNGGYNFKVKEFPSKSIAFLHLFFWCALIFIFKFFFHLQ